MKIYTCKDGRVRAYDKSTQKVISYPKMLMEQAIGRSLNVFEEVHHIDGNPLNNDFSNLEIRIKGEHQREHSTKYFDKEMKCAGCGAFFVWTGKQQRTHYSNVSRIDRRGVSSKGPFCSKSCAGRYGRDIQLKRV